jgi:hypothetical protein
MVNNTEKLQLDNLRKELKFILPNHQLTHYRNLIQQLGWSERYPMRNVYSIYFDTIENDMLFDSIHGLSKREKIRLRYYNNYSDIHFERKIKIDTYGYKIKKIYSTLKKIDNNSLIQIALEATDWVGHKMFPASHVNYQRYYYDNLNNNVRITFDTNIQTKDLQNLEHRNLKNYCICEVKIGINQICNLPFNLMPSRFSKYAFSRVGNDSNY